MVNGALMVGATKTIMMIMKAVKIIQYKVLNIPSVFRSFAIFVIVKFIARMMRSIERVAIGQAGIIQSGGRSEV